MKWTYKSTTCACYLAFIVQAIVVNLTPILFIPLMERYGLTYTQLGLLVLINFITQVTCDIVFSKPLDRYGFRPFVVAAPILVLLGFGTFALSPQFFPANPYPGLIAGTILFSGAGGLMELSVSPIINAIPTDDKARAMSLSHSFYAWGQVAVVLLTTLMVFAMGPANWQWIVLIWMLLPAVNLFLFLKVPLGATVPEEGYQGLSHILRQPFFLVALVAIILGGATELCIAQWTSAFFERALGLPKVVGDTAGVCSFALMLGLGRLLYGILGKRIKVYNALILGSIGAVACFLIVALSTVNVLSLIACGICGLMVSLMWPGTLVVAADRFPLAGASMFAILAAGGDIGSSIGPYVMSWVTEKAPAILGALMGGLTPEQFGLRMGFLVAAIFPLGAFFCHLWLRHKSRFLVPDPAPRETE